MHDFRRLEVWRRSLALAVAIERQSRRVPRSDRVVIGAQIRRAALSIPANIAEGSAKQSDREFARFLRISLGSITEAESHVIIASDLELIDADDFASLSLQIEDVRKMLTGLAKRLTSDANRRAGKKAGRR